MKKTFEEWMKEVDKAVYAKVGMSVHDLPDCCFADWYEDKVSPKSAAARAVKMAKSEYERPTIAHTEDVMKYYVGCTHTTWTAFKAATVPTSDSHGSIYYAVIGPFRTKRGAEFMAKHGKGNPHLRNVDEAERAAKRASYPTGAPRPAGYHMPAQVNDTWIGNLE